MASPAGHIPDGVLWALGALTLGWIGLILMLWLQRGWAEEARSLIQRSPDLVRYCLGTVRDSSAPWKVRLALVGLLIYLLCPVDVVPDFIPVVGLLDDVLLVFVVLRYCDGKRVGRPTE